MNTMRINGPSNRQALCCPICGEVDGLHHRAVAVRCAGEDQDGIYALVEPGGTVTMRLATRAEFIGRRDDVRILFDCEQCGERAAELVLYQHKGATILFWHWVARVPEQKGRRP